MAVHTLFGQGTVTTGIQTDTASYSIGNEFEVSTSVSLTGIWWYSAPTAGGLPDACAIYDATAHTQIAGTLNSSPSWSGAAGSGWVKCTYPGTVTLSSGTKYEVVIHGPTAAANWYDLQQNYWSTGTGGSGITSGPLSAPNNATSQNGQGVFLAGASIAFPTSVFNASNFWVDVEVTDIAAGVTVPAPQLMVSRTEAVPGRGSTRIVFR